MFFKPLIADTNGSSVMNVAYEAGRVKSKDSIHEARKLCCGYYELFAV
jgi:hypothetical protein